MSPPRWRAAAARSPSWVRASLANGVALARAMGSLTVPASLIGVLRRPDLWATAMRVGGASLPRRGFGGGADAAGYLRFRRQTMFGDDAEARLSPEQLVEYLEWCRAQLGRRRTPPDR